MPRAADIVLVRRTEPGETPFRSIWRHLTTWNVLEYKGPTVAARPEHLALLVEVGLGIGRRLNEQRVREHQRPLLQRAISFWYLANRLTPGFLRTAEDQLHGLSQLGAGIWRGRILFHPLLLISSVELLMDDESLPLLVLAQGSRQVEEEVGRFLTEDRERLERYGGVFGTLHERAWREVYPMARSARGSFKMDIRPVVEHIGVHEAIRQIGLDAVIEQVGVDTIIRKVGKKEILRHFGVDQLLENLTPEAKEELTRRLLRERRSK
jgi:hypothetical protein